MIKVGDTFYVKAADEGFQQKGECGGAVTATLRYLLEKKIVDGVLAVRRGVDIFDGVPSLITDPERIEELSGSLHCAPLLQSNVLFKYLNGAKDIILGVVGVGCDALAMQKLSEKGIINRENLVLVGLNCSGTLAPVEALEMIQKFYETDPTDVVKEEIANGNFIIETRDHQHKRRKIDDIEERGYGRRKNCRRCEEKIPRTTDLAFGNWGVIGPDAGKATLVEVCSATGAQLLADAKKAHALIVTDPVPEGLEIRATIEKAMHKLATKWQRRDFVNPEDRNEFWLRQFSKCIKCLGCMKACPICACDECKLESKAPLWFEANELPPSPKLQFTRAAHVANDCVNCGQCEDACPVEIPLSVFFQQSSKEFGRLLARFGDLTSI